MILYNSIVDIETKTCLGVVVVRVDHPDELAAKIVDLIPNGRKGTFCIYTEEWDSPDPFELDRWYTNEEARSLGCVTEGEYVDIIKYN